MEWFEACMDPSVATSRYAQVPALDPFPIFDCQLDPGLSTFNVTGYLPRLPEHTDLPDGQIPDRAYVELAFKEVCHFQLSGVPDSNGGSMGISKKGETAIEFLYESAACRFSGACHRVNAFIGVAAKFDPSHQEPRGPRLFSHPNVWNSCLLLLREYGYSLRASGLSAHRDNPARLRWHAEMPGGTHLRGSSPIELLGLATLHRHCNPRVHSDRWYQLDGPFLVSDLITQWEASL